MPRNLSHLKLHTEDAQSNFCQDQPGAFDLNQLLIRFSDATGWIPRPVKGLPHQQLGPLPDGQEPLLPLRKRMKLISNLPMDGMLDLEESNLGALTSEDDAWHLLEQIDVLVQELKQAEHVVQRQEAQMASSMGVKIRKEEAEVLTAKLKETLKRAIEQTGSDAGALYLLDDMTSELKMRCCEGLPTSALCAPARELRGSMADLEALMGNAVLIEDTKLATEWCCPENFAAAMCLPIGSPTMPHGTIWLWSEHIRDFGPQDIEIAKATSEKILTEIERSVLAEEVLKNRDLDRQMETAGLIQSSRLPDNQPLHADYEIAGWTFQGNAVGGNFHAWTMNRHEHICAALCSANSSGAAGSLVATSVQTVIDACWNSRHKPAQILRKANDLLWPIEDGDWRASLSFLKIHPESGSVEYSLAGDIQMFLVSSRGVRALRGTSAYLAEQPDTSFMTETLVLEGGELLVAASGEVFAAGADEGNEGLTQDNFLQVLNDMYEDRVEDISDHLARLLPNSSKGEHALDRSLLMLRRLF